ncbi:MAG: transglycosylase domain-containing protein [Dermatophilaceae bacterium]
MEGRAQNVSAVLRMLLGFVVLSTIAGLLMAGLAIPAVGAAGQAAQGGVEFFEDLPSDLASSPLAQQSRILDADGKVIANPYDENRIVVPLSKISKNMQNAQIAIEDSRFYEHGGLDPRGFTRAILSNAKGGDVQGASTITQQYVKVTQVDEANRRGDKAAIKAATEESIGRKLQELKYAVEVEENYTKEQILEGYLNLVYYGDQAYGVEAAALNYFGVSASKLDINQSALLAGIVQLPTDYNPVLNPKDSQRRRDQVLNRMQALGFATAEQVAAAKKVPVTSMIKKKPVKGTCFRSPQPYFCAYVMEWLQKSPQMAVLGKTPAERLKLINQGGLTIRTTLKPSMQQAAQSELVKAVPVTNKQNLGGAVSIVEPGTGKILAMAQANDFQKYQTNISVDQKYGGGPYGYQIGSTAKIWALTEALERGMPLESKLTIPRVTQETPMVFTQDQIRDECGFGERQYKVTNDYETGGTLTFRKAITDSSNPFFVKLNTQLGACSVRDTMVKMGLHRADDKPISDSLSGIALGAGESTPLSVASSIATLAAGGKYCEPNPVVSITTADGKEVKVPGPQCKKVISADVAAGVSDLLQSVVKDGPVRRVWSGGSRPVAGKTGTTDNQNQLWFSGYTPQLAMVVWVGNLEASTNRQLRSLRGKCFGSYGCPDRIFGSTVAAPMWSKIFKTVTVGMPVKQFPRPSEAIRRGNLDPLPNVVGRSSGDAAGILSRAGFTSHVESRVNSGQPAGTVVFTSPAGSALKGADIGLYLSTGQVPVQQPPPIGIPPGPDRPGKPGRPPRTPPPPGGG